MGAAGFPGALLAALLLSGTFPVGLEDNIPPWKRLLEQAKAPT